MLINIVVTVLEEKAILNEIFINSKCVAYKMKTKLPLQAQYISSHVNVYTKCRAV